MMLKSKKGAAVKELLFENEMEDDNNDANKIGGKSEDE